MSLKIIRFVSFFVAFFLLVANWAGVFAYSQVNSNDVTPHQEEPVSACESLDVIFVVDQSDSMSLAGLGSDPLESRKYSVAGMIELLADLAVDQCADSSYRVAVVSFGNKGQARVDLPLSNVAPNSIEEAQALRNKLTAALKADKLGQTYPLEGLAQASKIFRDASTFGDAPRKKVIIFLTDGIPCTEANQACLGTGDPGAAVREVVGYVNSAFPFNATLLKAEQCRVELRTKENPTKEEINACLVPDDKKRMYYGESTYIYTILLKSELSYPANMLLQFDEMSKAHGGRMVELKRNLSEIPSTMRQILSELAGIRPNLLSCGSPFAVNPYLKRLRVNVYNIAADNAIVLSYVDAQGQTHQIKAGEGDGGFTLAEQYYTYGVNERYVFGYPYPGLWQVTADNCSGVDIYVEAIDFLSDVEYYKPNLPDEIPQYDIEPFYYSDEPFILEYQMKVGDMAIEQAEPALFAIRAEALVKAPNGEIYAIPMHYNTASKKFIAESPLKVPQAGIYQLTLTGTTLRHEGDVVVKSTLGDAQVFNTPYELFHFENEFKVFAVNPFVMQEISPMSGSTIYHAHKTLWEGGWPLKNASLAIRVRLAGRDKQPLANWQDVFSDDNQAISAMVASENGEKSQIITLLPDPESPGEYIGEFSELGFVGTGTVQYQVNMQTVTETYRPDRQLLEVPFIRADGLWQRSTTYITIFWLIIALIVVIIIYNILIRTNKVTGSLMFVDGSETLAEFGLYNGTNFRIIRGKELNLYPQFSLKQMKVYNIGKKRRGSKTDELMVSGEPQGVRVECIGVDGNSFNVDLYPKTPTIYSDSGVGMMIYEPIEE